MNKSEIVNTLVLKTGQTPERMALVVRELFPAVAQARVDGERVDVRGFGSFTCQQYASRLWFNRRTGQVGRASARRRLRFKAGKRLQARIDVHAYGDAYEARMRATEPIGSRGSAEHKT